MTVLVGVLAGDDSLMGSDTVYEGTYRSFGPKIVRRNGYLIGAVGTVGAINLIEHGPVRPPKKPTEKAVWRYAQDLFSWVKEQGHGEQSDGTHENPCEFLLMCDGQLWELCDDGSVCPPIEIGPLRVATLGSGSEVALGAIAAVAKMDMHVAAKVALAVQTSIEYALGCGGKVQIESIP